MAYSYNSPGASAKDTVRFLIQDTDENAVLLDDAEINWLVDEANNNVYEAAAQACLIILAQVAEQSDETIGSTTVSASSKTDNYEKLYVKLKARADTKNRGIPLFLHSGLSQDDYPVPQFSIGMQDNVED